MDFAKSLSVVLLCLWGSLSVVLFYRTNLDHFTVGRHTDLDCQGSERNKILSGLRHGKRDVHACNIPKLDPWDKSVLPFVEHPRSFRCKKVQSDLTYLTADGILALNMSEKSNAEKLFESSVTCSYSVLKRGSTDWRLVREPQVRITSNLTRFEGDTIEVKCGADSKEVYYNVHMTYRSPKMKKSVNNEQLSVLFILLESISHSSMRRHLSKSYSYLRESMHANVFSGYNKIGVNTFPNLIAILTGKSTVELPPNLRNEFLGRDFSKDFYDDYPFIWKNFTRAGYTISYDEDRSDLGPFHYEKKGFQTQFFNFSSRPFHVAIRQHPLYKRSSKFCFGNQAIAMHQIKLLRELIASNSGKKYFHTTFFVDLSHNYENDIERIDGPLYETLKFATENNLLNNTVVFVFGDHGARFGNVRQTDVGYYEERMPFLSISLPAWFRRRYPHIALNMETNEQRLSTPFDLFETLSDVLHRQFEPRRRRSLRRGISLLDELPANRDCENAGVPEQFCVCYPTIKVSTSSRLAEQAGFAILDHVDAVLLNESERCFQLQIDTLISVNEVIKNYHDGASKLYRVVIKTSPNNALLEGLVTRGSVEHNFTIVGKVERINRYHRQSYCVNSQLLKNYCLCRD